MFLDDLGLGSAPVFGVEPAKLARVRKSLARCARHLVAPHCPSVYEELVALTGIERVWRRFSMVQLGLSECEWV